ncbi:MAG: hypothetical protein IIC90_13620 [Chloroflexi bacterium]|nr:hypothetical protein [Chloroflexota bacterium]
MKLLAAALASIVIALIVVACGGEGVSSQEKLAKYFQEFERVEAELKEQAEFSGGFDAPRLNADFQSAIAGVSPPGEAQVLHDELVDALEVYTQVLQDFADRPQSPDFPDLNPLKKIQERVIAACDGLEELATQRGIEVHLGCASSSPPGAKPTSPAE